MQYYVHSGYLNLYRPPHSVLNSVNGASIYAVSTKFNNALVIIPLVPSFYRDVINLVKNNPSRKVYLVASDIGIAFVSDYYLCWDTIVNTYRKECVIFSRFMPENFVYNRFKDDILRTENNNISIEIPRSELDVGTIDISLSKNFVSAATPFACDVILNDTHKRRIFVSEINEHKAYYLNQNKDLFDEIHIPYIRGNYATWTCNELLKKYPSLVSKILCNQFASDDEFNFAIKNGIKIGGAFDNDFI